MSKNVKFYEFNARSLYIFILVFHTQEDNFLKRDILGLLPSICVKQFKNIKYVLYSTRHLCVDPDPTSY